MSALNRFRGATLVVAVMAASVVFFGSPRQATAFCGFYVGKADSSLWNQASEVVLVREGERTVLTMSNDFQGELTDFALVVPVPVLLEEGQIHVGERAHIDHLDAFTAPRLVEYFDEDPCMRHLAMDRSVNMAAEAPSPSAKAEGRARSLGVTIEAQYTVGEYDILILSAKESSGLETWLTESGYRLPKGASRALAPYIRQDFKFFVAKVNLKEQAKTGFTHLRPLQMAYESRRFMLPIRLGMVNARGAQDLIVYALTRTGRVETSNYRTLKVPSDVEVPLFVKEEFKDFYRSMFDTTWQKEGRNVAILEHFWNMAWCDPCAADPLSPEELRGLGVFWLGGDTPRGRQAPQGPNQVLVTRLHVRYDEEHFPEDLAFQETGDTQNFQGRYILRHPFTGEMSCGEAGEYKRGVVARREQEAQTAVRLTGWSLEAVRRKMGQSPYGSSESGEKPWWKDLWK